MRVPSLRRRAVLVMLGATSVLVAACGSPTPRAAPAARGTTTEPGRTAPSTAPAAPEAVAVTGITGRTSDAGSGAPEVSGHNVNDAPTVGVPTAVEIPSIGVRSDLLRLGLASDGTAEVPGDPQRAGWFSGGVRPGDEGPAIILGHIDSRTGPAIFYRLHELSRGAKVSVDTASGRRVGFTVDRVEQVSKRSFPTDEVYGPAFGRQLRLITCGGTFDRSRGHYSDNVIVFLTATRRGARS